MAVKIRPKFNAKDIAKWSADVRIRILAAIQSRLEYVGETFIVNARNTDTYKDDTGNLRSSIGYMVVRDGVIQGSNFEAQNRGSTSGETGVQTARQLAQDIADEYPQGFVLVCVAGMHYAASLESRGYDVITNSTITAVDELRQAMQRLRQQINRIR